MPFHFVQRGDCIVANCAPSVNENRDLTSFVDGNVSQFVVSGLSYIPVKATLEVGAMLISSTRCFNIIDGNLELLFFKKPTPLPLYKLLLQELSVQLFFKNEDMAALASRECTLDLIKSSTHEKPYSVDVSACDIFNNKYPEDPNPINVPIDPSGLLNPIPGLSLIFTGGWCRPSHVLSDKDFK